MRVAAVTMAMSMQSARRAAEAAIGRAAVRPSVRAGDEHIAWTAIPSRHEAHRHGADGRASHQRQHHTTRAFHGLRFRLLTVPDDAEFPSPVRTEASESRSFHGFVRGMAQPPEKPKACANEPKPPRVTPPEEVLDVPDAEWFEEESLL